jgi:hypothetical protein
MKPGFNKEGLGKEGEPDSGVTGVNMKPAPEQGGI